MSTQQTQIRPEDKAIESLVDYLASKLYPGLRVTERPDKKPGTSGEIDAIAKSPRIAIAIEHTSIDAFPNQRRDNSRFLEVFDPLEKEFRDRADLRACIVVPFGAVPTGTNWNTIRSTLQNWIPNNVPSLCDGTTEHNIDGVPFSVLVLKPSLAPRLWFARSAKDDPDFDKRLRLLINEKAEKLQKYRKAGYFSILIIENSDIANMNRSTMIISVAKAYPQNLPPSLDRIWFADTSIPDSYQFWNITPKSRAQLALMSATDELENPPA